MRVLLITALLSLPLLGVERVTYGSRVRVVAGFYQGCIGTAVEELGETIVVRDIRCEGSLKKGDVLITISNLRKVK